MKRHLIAALAACALVPDSAVAQATPSDSTAIMATALDYIEGWYTRDAARMERALHPHLVKRFLEPRTDGGYN
jgi:hypothetical protein